jgi:FkbM family methyltransferase
MEARSDLIYDVGLFDGGDTAYYLFRGYNVVAIDANPAMIEKARVRFSQEILAKRLTLLNVGIAATSGTTTFWISDCPEWSSLDKTIASRDGAALRSVSVSTVPFSELLAEHGTPHYLKIDIEGNDRLCVDALRGGKVPKYISVESECVGDADEPSDEMSLTMLELLREVGYRKFKLVKQLGWIPIEPNGAVNLYRRFIRSAARGRLRAAGLSRIAERLTVEGRIAASSGFVLSSGSSGPWGDDIPGEWMTYEKAKSVYLRARHAYFSKDRARYSFWCDWHATY